MEFSGDFLYLIINELIIKIIVFNDNLKKNRFLFNQKQFIKKMLPH